jgi:hypothetical protein
MKVDTAVTSLLTDVDVVTPPTDIGRIAAVLSLVELPGIETGSLPGVLHSELRFRYISFQFSPIRYLRFCSRVLTASRVGIR